jgi:hypothetical protein
VFTVQAVRLPGKAYRRKYRSENGDRKINREFCAVAFVNWRHLELA